MDLLLYWPARLLIALLQALPLPVVARLGRLGGTVAWWIDRRHRNVALDNLTQVFGAEKSAGEIRALARENLKRIGENYACGIKIAALPARAIPRILTVAGAERLPGSPENRPNVVMAVGHFGNFELYPRADQFVSGFRFGVTYRALRQPVLNRLFLAVRERSGCLYFERRTQAAELKAAMHGRGLMVGLLADQHAGDRGAWLPFLGRECSTSTAPAIFALRYKCPLHAAICHRVGVGRWRIEIGEAIPTEMDGRPREVEAITHDVNRVLEAAIRRDPVNWFWVHRRWKRASRFQIARQSGTLPAEP